MKMKKLLDLFNKTYDFIYEKELEGYEIAGYYEAIEWTENFLKTEQGKKIISDFVSYRQDLLMSDREFAVFAFAMEKYNSQQPVYVNAFQVVA